MLRALALSLVFFLAACASAVPGQTVRQRLFAAQSDYVALQRIAIFYVQLPTCSATQPMPCKTTEVALAIKRANDVAVPAFLEAAKFPTDGTLVDKAVAAALAVRNVLVQNNVPSIAGVAL